MNWEGPREISWIPIAFPGVSEYQGFDRWHSQNIYLGSCPGPRSVSSGFCFIPQEDSRQPFKFLPSRMAPASFAVRHAFESHF